MTVDFGKNHKFDFGFFKLHLLSDEYFITRALLKYLIMLHFGMLILGFVLLIFGANYLVDGASSLAKRLNVSDLVIGMTVVAFGTSLPELMVNLFASFKGNSDIAIGNILGSNVINVFVIIGIAAIIRPINVQSSTVKVEIPYSLLAVVMIAVMANDVFFEGAPASVLSKIDGFVLLTFFIIFLYYTFFMTENDITQEVDIQTMSKWKSIGLIAVGLIGLYFGGRFIVDHAVIIAENLGVSESIIGLTIVALGTSLPELATSVIAATKGNSDIAVGNVVGSNIFNIFFVLGLSSSIRALPFSPSSNIDIMMACLASIFLFAFVFIGEGRKIDRFEGALFLVIYGAYVTYLLW